MEQERRRFKGRPPVVGEARRTRVLTKQVGFQVTEIDHEEIARQADQTGMPIGQFIREVLVIPSLNARRQQVAS